MPFDFPTLLDPAYKSLCKQIADEVDTRVYALASGSASLKMEDTKTVAEKYAGEVSYIQALLSVIDICKELERKRYGDRPGDKDN